MIQVQHPGTWLHHKTQIIVTTKDKQTRLIYAEELGEALDRLYHGEYESIKLVRKK